jgi:glycerophosphoryl diester phosphodiesterase
MRLIHLVARRGNSAEFPENTLPALRSAIALGARFIELDVHLSADGTPMAFRDQELARVGQATATAAELERLEAGEVERFGEQFRGTHLVTLATALGLLAGRPEITIFVVIGRQSIVRFGHDQVVARVTRTLKPFRSRCVVGSSDLAAVHSARATAGCPIAWTLPAYDDHTRLKYETLQPDYIFCDRAHLPQRTALWRGPWRWAIYEVDSLHEALSLAERGADFVVTRNVRALSAAMLAHAGAGGAATSDDDLVGATHPLPEPPAHDETHPLPESGDTPID